MVLLTSSTISVAISSSIICTFTFLLFMSGYVMQQQTVRSLQDALHAPPVPKPTPTLPPQFQKPSLGDVSPVVEVAAIVAAEGDRELGTVDEGLPAGDNTKPVVETGSNLESPGEPPVILSQNTASNPDGESSPNSLQVIEDANPDEATSTITAGVSDIEVPSSESSSELSEPSASTRPLRLAYVLTAAQPSQICSALLFFRQHSQSYKQGNTSPAPAYLLLYPSRWETDPSHEAYTTAISLMRDAQDSLDITYHPVRTTEAWSGLASASIQNQLLGELLRYHWVFDRMLYLKTPGLAMDIAALDAAISSTPASLRRNWVLLSKKSSAREATDPPIMLLSEKGTVIPRGELRGRLTVSAATGSHVGRHTSDLDVEAASKSAAYVYFNQEELEHRREEKEWNGGVFEKYERGVNEVCKGSVFAMEKGELRR